MPRRYRRCARNWYRRIVNVSSHLGSLASMAGTNVSYRVSKAALNALTRVLAAELAGSGIPRQRLLPGADEYAHGVRRDRPDPGGWRGHAGMAGDPADDGPTGGLFAERQPPDW